jgi:hypothetical protein
MVAALVLAGVVAGRATAAPAHPPAHHHAAADTTAHAHHHDATMPGMAAHPGHDHAAMSMTAHAGHAAVPAMYGPYRVSREASGTSWQPDAAAHAGVHVMRGEWSLMVHGQAGLVYDQQGGPRGDHRVFSDNMVMALASRPAGPGRLGLRLMASLEPATIGKEGYPLLLQPGETADGVHPLVDRQHPHDLLMELAGVYRVTRGANALFLYAGLPGEPALGPPAYMHRASGADAPETPISHHWLDSSHVTWGVLTLGAVLGDWKLEASAFRGREPDEQRWNIETPKLDSHAFRASWNPAPAWSLQASHGRLASVEELEPGVDVDRTTASAIWDTSRPGRPWQTTLAWGRNRARPGHTLDAALLETAVTLEGRHTLTARIERARKDELFESPDPRAGDPFTVGKLAASYRYDFWRGEHVSVGAGALGSVSFVPAALDDAYVRNPFSGMLFARAKLR